MPVKIHSWREPGGAVNRHLKDPRSALARQMAWIRPTGMTTDCRGRLEPDNYNWAVISRRPIDISSLDESFIYKDATTDLWITLARVDDTDINELINYLKDYQYYAIWHNPRPFAIRKRLAYDK